MKNVPNETLRFVPHGAGNARGIIYFGYIEIGWADLVAPGMYVPNFAKKARTLRECAIHLTTVRRSKTKRKLEAYGELLSVLRDLRT